MMLNVFCFKMWGELSFSHHKETGNRNLWVIFYSEVGGRCEAVIYQNLKQFCHILAVDLMPGSVEIKFVRIVLSVA